MNKSTILLIILLLIVVSCASEVPEELNSVLDSTPAVYSRSYRCALKVPEDISPANDTVSCDEADIADFHFIFHDEADDTVVYDEEIPCDLSREIIHELPAPGRVSMEITAENEDGDIVMCGEAHGIEIKDDQLTDGGEILLKYPDTDCDTNTSCYAASRTGIPIHHWSFDESNDSRVIDIMGGNDGEIHGNVTRTAGVQGSGLQFDGQQHSDYVDLQEVVDFTYQKSYTISFWVYLEYDPADLEYVDEDFKGVGVIGPKQTWYNLIAFIHPSIFCDYEGPLCDVSQSLLCFYESAYGKKSWACVDVAPRQWRHIAFVFRHDTMISYGDGKEGYQRFKDGEPKDFFGNMRIERFGIEYGEDNKHLPFYGRLDEIKIFDYALCPEEIAALADDRPE